MSYKAGDLVVFDVLFNRWGRVWRVTSSTGGVLSLAAGADARPSSWAHPYQVRPATPAEIRAFQLDQLAAGGL